MIVERSSLERTLAAAGQAPVEPVGPRLDALERRLRNTMSATESVDHRVVAELVGSERHRPRRLTRPVVLGVAACLIATIVLAAGWISGRETSYVIAAADTVQVTFPDGSTVRGAPGVTLPVGAEVDVVGSMEVGGVLYGPGRYTVTDGGVVRLGDDPGRSPPDPGTDGGTDGAGLAPVAATSTTVMNTPAIGRTTVTTTPSPRQPPTTSVATTAVVADRDSPIPVPTRPPTSPPVTPPVTPPTTRPADGRDVRPTTTVTPTTATTTSVRDPRPPTTTTTPTTTTLGDRAADRVDQEGNREDVTDARHDRSNQDQ